MNDIPCAKRVFPFRLASWLPTRYASYLHWLSHLLERLGHDCTLSLWQDVCQDYDDELLLRILRTGWNDVAQDRVIDVEESIAALFPRFFPVAIEGVSEEKARQLVEKMPPINQLKQTFPSLNVWKETTAYEALHLSFDGFALLTEALMRFHGKQGELIAYDLLREGRIKAGGGKTGSAAEFISDFTSEPEEANIFTAGLEIESVHVSEREVVLQIKECEWARYFQERHPQVGYLMACSTDEAAYRAFNGNLRLRRTSTLMEGGKVCDFRIYAVAHEPLYVSKRMPRNLWQDYRVFSDRIEIQCRFLLSTFIIPFNNIKEVSLSRPLAIEIFRAKAWKGGPPIKLDFVVFYTHIVIRRNSGLLRNLRFTPDDPHLFLSVCRQAHQHWEKGLYGSADNRPLN